MENFISLQTMKTIEIKIRDLRTNNGQLEGLPRNPRKISKKQLEKLKKSLTDAPEMLRLRELICVEHPDGPVVICGNQRLEAAKALGWETLPCKVLPADTDPAKLREYAIKDNLPFGEDDWEVIASDWDTAELEEWGMAVPEEWKDTKKAEEDDFDPDSVKETVCKKGDIWQLGDHRLMCGDSTDAGDVALLMDGEKADLLLTDPPYGINIVSNKKVGGDGALHFGKVGGNNIVKATQYKPITGDNTTIAAEESYKISINFTLNQIIFGGNYFTAFLPPKSCWLVWDKENTGNFGDVELAWTSFDKSTKIYRWMWNGLSRKGQRKIELAKRVHPTQKPVGMISEIIKDFTKEGDSVLYLFGGSGTTLIAAEQMKRKCYMMELDPHYCDVIIARWEKLTGKKATKIN